MPAVHELPRETLGRKTRASFRVDREKGIIYGVKLQGKRSRNDSGKRYYSDTLLERFVSGMYEEVPVQVGHQVQPAQMRIGVIRNPRWEQGMTKDGRIIIGDWHLNKSHALFEQFMEDAEKFPSNIVLSHELVGWQERTTTEGTEIYDAEKVLWFSIVPFGGSNESLIEGDDMRLSNESTVAEFRTLYPNLSSRFESTIREECECSMRKEQTDTETELAQLRDKVKAYEDAEALRKRTAEIREEFARLTADMDKSLVESNQLDDDQMAAFAKLPPEAASAAIKAIVSALGSASAVVQESASFYGFETADPVSHQGYVRNTLMEHSRPVHQPKQTDKKESYDFSKRFGRISHHLKSL